MMLLGLILHMILLIILLCLKVRVSFSSSESYPSLCSAWALPALDGRDESTAKRFLRRMAPSCVVDGDMRGFSKAMFEGLVDNPDGPPPPLVEPPTIPLELPPSTFLGMDEGESSRPSRAKRARTDDKDRYDSEEEEETDDHHLEAREEDESEEYRTEDAAGGTKKDYAWDTEDDYAEDLGPRRIH